MVNIRKLLRKRQHFHRLLQREAQRRSTCSRATASTWLQIINDSTKGKDNYVDLDIELLNLLQRTYSENMKKYVKKLNNDLSNIASYSIGFLSDDPEKSRSSTWRT
jgi:hypothetical protein